MPHITLPSRFKNQSFSKPIARRLEALEMLANLGSKPTGKIFIGVLNFNDGWGDLDHLVGLLLEYPQDLLPVTQAFAIIHPDGLNGASLVDEAAKRLPATVNIKLLNGTAEFKAWFNGIPPHQQFEKNDVWVEVSEPMDERSHRARPKILDQYQGAFVGFYRPDVGTGNYYICPAPVGQIPNQTMGVGARDAGVRISPAMKKWAKEAISGPLLHRLSQATLQLLVGRNNLTEMQAAALEASSNLGIAYVHKPEDADMALLSLAKKTSLEEGKTNTVLKLGLSPKVARRLDLVGHPKEAVESEWLNLFVAQYSDWLYELGYDALLFRTAQGKKSVPLGLARGSNQHLTVAMGFISTADKDILSVISTVFGSGDSSHFEGLMSLNTPVLFHHENADLFLKQLGDLAKNTLQANKLHSLFYFLNSRVYDLELKESSEITSNNATRLGGILADRKTKEEFLQFRELLVTEYDAAPVFELLLRASVVLGQYPTLWSNLVKCIDKAGNGDIDLSANIKKLVQGNEKAASSKALISFPGLGFFTSGLFNTSAPPTSLQLRAKL